MFRSLVALTLLLAALLAPPASADSAGLDLVGTLPDATRAISINFLRYDDGRDVMLVSTQDGLRSYDLTADPAHPKPLDVLSKEELMLPGDQADPLDQGFWENEDMDVDPRRKLAFLSRDVLAFSKTTAGVQIVDAANPADLKLGRFVPLPVGHTTTCINGCDYLWTAGWGARAEVWVTDLRDPALPIPSPLPHLTDTRTEMPSAIPPGSHDVQVDSAGIAWVSGVDGVRGFRTSGDGATATAPVAYGGGTVGQSDGEGHRFMHNALRPGGGEVLLGTQEQMTTCDDAGRLVISSLRGHTDGDVGGELETLGTWSPAAKEGTGAAANCSAHYFDLRGDVLVQSFYGEGTRFLDVRDPRNPIQVAYFRPDGAASWAPYWHGDLVYVADNQRGVDILRLRQGGSAAPITARPVGTAGGCAPPTAEIAARAVRLTRRSIALRGSAHGVCGIARVEVAVSRVAAGRCAFLGRRGRLGRPRACREPVWLRARGTARWTFLAKGRLRRGSYSATVRAIAADGTPGTPTPARLTARGAQREVLAPRRSAGAAAFFDARYGPSEGWGLMCPVPRPR